MSAAWIILVYQLPSEPSSKRVNVWRDLKRLGALYLQQSTCIVPASGERDAAMQAIGQKIDLLEGAHHLFRVPSVDHDEEALLVDGFRQQSAAEYQEIIDETSSRLLTRIEFERFRDNFSYDTAEDLRSELERLRERHARSVERDFFGASMRTESEAALARCEEQLEAYEDATYRLTAEVYGPES